MLLFNYYCNAIRKKKNLIVHLFPSLTLSDSLFGFLLPPLPVTMKQSSMKSKLKID